MPRRGPPVARDSTSEVADFAASVADARLRERLEVALDGRGAFRRFKAALLDDLAERDRWFSRRDARLRAAAREWLAAQGIEPTTEPPASRHGLSDRGVQGGFSSGSSG